MAGVGELVMSASIVMRGAVGGLRRGDWLPILTLRPPEIGADDTRMLLVRGLA